MLALSQIINLVKNWHSNLSDLLENSLTDQETINIYAYVGDRWICFTKS